MVRMRGASGQAKARGGASGEEMRNDMYSKGEVVLTGENIGLGGRLEGKLEGR